MRDRDPGQWYLIFDGVAAGNGSGRPVEAGEAGRIARAFRPPLCFDRVRMAGFYDDAGFCEDCGAPYCARHWHLSGTGYGHCPLVTVRAWTRTGSQPKGPAAMPRVDEDQQQLLLLLRALIVRKTAAWPSTARRAMARPRPGSSTRCCCARDSSAPPACSPGCRAWTRTG